MEVFHSHDPRYRAPTGAVPAGTDIRIVIKPESSRFPLRGFFCAEYERTGEKIELQMQHIGPERDREVFTVNFRTSDTPAGRESGLVWYYFRFENKGGFFFYGNNPGQTGGSGMFYGDKTPKPYQLTLYEDGYDSPKWFGQGICYHIFPDRFCRLSVPEQSRYASRDRLIHTEWGDTPNYLPEKDGEIRNRDFFGGSLEGIRSKLSYLRGLGVTCIYLSPVFEAYSNHRYDTADYLKIDPLLGTNEEFSQLCADAKQHGIRILLDGVFNHTGFDSIYFNGKGRYDALGAAQSADSPYYSWYSFQKWPEEYLCWWGFCSLPKVNATNPDYVRFIAGEEDSVVRRWISAGASGWRLDVADEIPDDFIKEINKAAKAENEEALIIGEVWEDASNKISYGVRRNYLLGGGLDGVMNYPFRTAVIDYLKGGSSAIFRETMESIAENYPPYALHSAMNILGTHDTARILSILGTSSEILEGEKAKRAERWLTQEERETAVRLLKIGSLLQFCFYGCPTVYYGDEAGMEGFEDPFNRRGFVWGYEDQQLLAWYRKLGEVRNATPAIREGSLTYINTGDAVLAFQRHLSDEDVIIACNRSDAIQPIVLPSGNGSRTDRSMIFIDAMAGEKLEFKCTSSGEALSAMLQPMRAYLLVKAMDDADMDEMTTAKGIEENTQ